MVDYIEPDHLGTPRAVIDPTRNVAVWKWPILIDAFGESAPNQDPDADGTNFILNLRFPGQEWDSESGMSYNFRRDYDSASGRYLESDRLGLVGGSSTYAFGRGRPLVRIDRLGLLTVAVQPTIWDNIQGPHNFPNYPGGPSTPWRTGVYAYSYFANWTINPTCIYCNEQWKLSQTSINIDLEVSIDRGVWNSANIVRDAWIMAAGKRAH